MSLHACVRVCVHVCVRERNRVSVFECICMYLFIGKLPLGEKTLRLIGIEEMPLLEPVMRSVSASISCRTSSKSTNFLPLQCKNSAYSVDTVTHTQGSDIGSDIACAEQVKTKTHKDNTALDPIFFKEHFVLSVQSIWSGRGPLLTCFVVDQLQNKRPACDDT